MIEDKFNAQMESLGGLSEETPGWLAHETSPVLATPALAFAGGAALVTGAYAVGKVVGSSPQG
ncbi:hypothetical protein ACWC0A_35995 [Streptomyces scopuliridis]|uniref:Uncharacterized protein n=2 Tax=Streptomyces scopuliridis TaxID=452529 RepID=A0A2T7SME0_9ACTN|nr:hypothetical protein [Streptomyces scopuliridis]PVE04083.1 hypothetical protein Y717_14280 [Streptomyces scopuliridis RB72]WSB32891.1 hypothetical protein OG949_08440 [Streptomyces scopuliridis]WSB97138.1 hypothetical protein OG835_09025 [Streptomyces scopuliridis]WSC09158.1 hypothetical protein OIE62_31910 [Streptomyces scopuliridis]